jgi:hypothetical protein
LARFFQERLEGYPASVRIVENVVQTAAGKHRIVRSDLHDIPAVQVHLATPSEAEPSLPTR